MRGFAPTSFSRAAHLLLVFSRRPLWTADAMLPKDQRLPSGSQAHTWIEKYKKTIQAIRPSGLIRDEDSRVVPTFGAGYVGILFPFRGAMISDPHSISLEGDCDAIPSPHPQPTVLQLFQIGAIHLRPTDLAEEIRDGRVRLQLFIGNEVLSVEPKVIRELQSIRWKNWPTLDLARMYGYQIAITRLVHCIGRELLSKD